MHACRNLLYFYAKLWLFVASQPSSSMRCKAFKIGHPKKFGPTHHSHLRQWALIWALIFKTAHYLGAFYPHFNCVIEHGKLTHHKTNA